MTSEACRAWARAEADAAGLYDPRAVPNLVRECESALIDHRVAGAEILAMPVETVCRCDCSAPQPPVEDPVALVIFGAALLIGYSVGQVHRFRRRVGTLPAADHLSRRQP